MLTSNNLIQNKELRNKELLLLIQNRLALLKKKAIQYGDKSKIGWYCSKFEWHVLDFIAVSQDLHARKHTRTHCNYLTVPLDISQSKKLVDFINLLSQSSLQNSWHFSASKHSSIPPPLPYLTCLWKMSCHSNTATRQLLTEVTFPCLSIKSWCNKKVAEEHAENCLLHNETLNFSGQNVVRWGADVYTFAHMTSRLICDGVHRTRVTQAEMWRCVHV